MLVDGAVNAVDIVTTVATEGEGMMADQRDGECTTSAPFSNVPLAKSSCLQRL